MQIKRMNSLAAEESRSFGFCSNLFLQEYHKINHFGFAFHLTHIKWNWVIFNQNFYNVVQLGLLFYSLHFTRRISDFFSMQTLK